ncbi:hypothetical protein GTA62_14850 [Roseobacter sp. HKCCD9010]|uniref:hypothetical protein n=1 Tax=unclassified Roseobacter TaxID=196798 RepID=UPI0014925C30|nr:MULTISPECIES: hypothetical protein [unclassified Roseobacter]MBF9050610.1 hypothetical protein [Rhodobacterales bacterium HKCCD4356]NNV11972.1 hypothetical protein [Roseobacter sp. HKCCD7357]NNV16985.1 hypothetical protein [Roseobacter sp. HKCCD8768]NNV26214.1 hypothetical protein [Roseobacter sp. HKCCD8192]NNV30710.1 hypothetical protein [Roseobacter sp. HKCCD9061]
MLDRFQPIKPPLRFTHAPCFIGGKTEPGDRVVRCNGHNVGRVHQRVSDYSGRWQWMTWAYPASQGDAPTNEAALAMVKGSVTVLIEKDGGLTLDKRRPPQKRFGR